ncbi:MAG: hypothetical protein IKN69_01790, partial [Bacilli bacterium]|nr:hypothetical protein [Bacilli bacterium]
HLDDFFIFLKNRGEQFFVFHFDAPPSSKGSIYNNSLKFKTIHKNSVCFKLVTMKPSKLVL